MPETLTLGGTLTIMLLTFTQAVSFSMTSRARNRDKMIYHAICVMFSNATFFLTLHHLVASELALWMMAPYTLGTAAGSLSGAAISMRIERLIGAKT